MATGGRDVDTEPGEAEIETEERQQQEEHQQEQPEQQQSQIPEAKLTGMPEEKSSSGEVKKTSAVEAAELHESNSKMPTVEPTAVPLISSTPIASGNDPPSCDDDDVPLNNQYFFEDEVFRIDKKGRIKFGLVIETSDTFSGDEDDDFDDVLQKGEVRVAWYPEGKEEVQTEGAIALADRTLMPGDVVRRMIPGKDTQRGYCREISMHADVKVLGTKNVIKNVMTERLRPINQWQRDSAVCLDSWVGSTKSVEEKAVLKATSGALVEISCNDYYAFSDFNSTNSRGIYNPYIFYPGNVVFGRLPSLDTVRLLTPDIPIHKNRKGKPFKGKYTVESVETDAVWVHWQCKALSEENHIENNLLEQPNPCVAGENLKRLKRLNLFESCMLQISDRNYLRYSKVDTVIRKSQWDKEQAMKFKLILAQQQKADNLNLYVHSSNTSNTSGSQKPKKKLSQLDVDKSNKSKKLSLKADKLSSSISKDKSQINEAASGQSGNTLLKNNLKQSRETSWVTEDENDDDDEDSCDDIFDEVGTTTTCSSPSPHNSPKHMKRRLLRKRSAAAIKKETEPPEEVPKDGDELVTEALLVYSTATVVWQDGSIETGIPSTQLYPIQHLDNHEFFPGDFVISAKEDSDVSFRDYGVIQKVDHHGRTARVKWFTTYTSSDEPKPTYKGETEVSVYDLKDHPDFQYRPGTMVIRVANFSGEDANCTAGQIIDNYTDGRAKVWWVDGHISMCWPQDLFEFGQYDHTDWGHDSEDSWETESENSEVGNATPKVSLEESHILTNIERARVAIARLEEIFNLSPNLQNPEVMRKLLTVYKGCRYLDRLLSTTFFHEDNFSGLIERVRKNGSQPISERAQDRKNRLFSYVQPTSPNAKSNSQQSHTHNSCHYQAIVSVNNGQKFQGIHTSSANVTNSKEYAPKILFNISSTPFKRTTPSCSNINGATTSSSNTAETGGSSALHVANHKRKPTVTTSTPDVLSSTTVFNLKAMPHKNVFKSATSVKSNESEDSQYEEVTIGNHIFVKEESKSECAVQSGTTENKALSATLCSIVSHCVAAEGITEDSPMKKEETMDSTQNVTIEELTEEAATSSDTMNDEAVGSAANVSAEAIKEVIAPANYAMNFETVPIASTQVGACTIISRPELSAQKLTAYIVEKNQLLNSAMHHIERAYEKTSQLKTVIANSQDDSGNYSRNENCDGSSTSYASSLDLTNVEINGSLNKTNEEQKSMSCSSVELNEDVAPELVCVRLCALLKEQLVKCIQEIREKYYKDEKSNVSDFDLDTLNESEMVYKVEKYPEISQSEEDANATLAMADMKSPVSSTITEYSFTHTTASPNCFQVLPSAPKTHKCYLTIFSPGNSQQYFRAIQREQRMLMSSLPPGVWVRVFEDRMDLLSVMIEGPRKTPYEDGLFFFDIQLGRDYPKTPPLCHYISFCTDRLNPNLYEDGKVCVSLLGTWTGRDTEVWGPKSTLLQVIVSIQGLILVPEPYFNEAGYDKQRGTQQGSENSRMYNEMVIIKMVQATTKLLHQSPEIFRQEVIEFYRQRGMYMYERIKGWVELSNQAIKNKTEEANRSEATTTTATEQNDTAATVPAENEPKFYEPPDFPLVPASRGFCLTLTGPLENFKSKLEALCPTKSEETESPPLGGAEVDIATNS